MERNVTRDKTEDDKDFITVYPVDSPCPRFIPHSFGSPSVTLLLGGLVSPRAVRHVGSSLRSSPSIPHDPRLVPCLSHSARRSARGVRHDERHRRLVAHSVPLTARGSFRSAPLHAPSQPAAVPHVTLPSVSRLSLRRAPARPTPRSFTPFTHFPLAPAARTGFTPPYGPASPVKPGLRREDE